MARNKSGGFNKVLEFIGLVDDGAPRDEYDDEYESGNYGRQQAYQPARNTARAQDRQRGQQPMSRRYEQNYQPTRTPRMSRSNSSSRFEEQRTSQRRSQEYGGGYSSRSSASNRAPKYDYSPRPSRFDDSSRYDDAPASSRAQQNGARQRTVMFALHSLEDCCDVIDNLILSNTVVLTMDDLDPALMTRAIDTLSGAVFALHATIRKASERTYLIAPMSVEVNADDTFETFRRR